MRNLAPMMLAILTAACTPQRPPVAAPSPDQPETLPPSSWETVHARLNETVAIAPNTLHENGYPAMWVKWEYRPQRVVSDGKPDRRALVHEQYVWMEADCESGRIRESHHRSFADGESVTAHRFAEGVTVSQQRRRATVGWRPVRPVDDVVLNSVCMRADEVSRVSAITR